MSIIEKPIDLKSEELCGTEREYNIKCRVVVKKQYYKEIADDRTHEVPNVYLIPDVESTEGAMFLSAWLPSVGRVCLDCGADVLRLDVEECKKCSSKNLKLEWTECPTFVGHPINSPCRMAVLRKNRYCNEHHLYVMGMAVSDELRFMNGKSVSLKVFPGTMDEICDGTKDFNRTVK